MKVYLRVYKTCNHQLEYEIELIPVLVSLREPYLPNFRGICFMILRWRQG